jgi:hypothetical protein
VNKVERGKLRTINQKLQTVFNLVFWFFFRYFADCNKEKVCLHPEKKMR